MSHEIYYTSAPEGLKPGSSGFSTVGISENIPKNLWDRLETLSAYRHHFTTASGHAGENPVSYAHWLLNIAGANYHVLSRVCDSGVDHTQRTNAFADHLVIENSEMAAAGPAWMLMQDLLADEWGGEVGTLPPRVLPQGDVAAAICTRWQEATGDAGWGGHLADVFVKTPTKPVCILFAPGQEILPLIAEAIALLPASARWLVTFNTYFTSMPTSATCAWRCCLAGSPAAQLGMRYASSGLIVDLTDPGRLGKAPDGPYATLARTGIAPEAPKKPAPVKPGRPTLKPAKAESVYELEEDDEEKEFEFEVTEPAAPVAVAPPASSEVKLPPPMKRLKPIMREADQALRKAEITADHGAAKRRKQFVVLFFGALLALAIGMGLVMVALHNSSPPEVPIGIKPPPVPLPLPATVVATPTPPAPIPVPITPKTIPAVATRPYVITPITPIPPPPPPVVIHYPAVIHLSDPIQKPSSASGFGDVRQTLSFTASDVDPAAAVSGIRLIFPGDAAGKEQYGDMDTLGGILTATPGETGTMPWVSIRWKGPNDATVGTEVLVLTYARGSVELDWKIAGLTSKPESLPVLFWLLQNSAVELQTVRGSSQKVAFEPYAPPPINLLDSQTSYALPSELPSAVLPVLASTLPQGWTVSAYVKPKDQAGGGALLSMSEQGLAFKKSAGAIDSYFVVTFDSTYQKMECNFSQRVAADQAELKKDQDQLQTLDDAIKQATLSNNGKQPDDAATHKMLDDRDTAQATVDTYKAVVAGYNDINQLDIGLELPGKARVVTFHLQRGVK